MVKILQFTQEGKTPAFSSDLTGIVTAGASSLTANTVTQYGVMVAGASNAASSITPDASTTKILVSGGASTNPSWQDISTGALALGAFGSTPNSSGASLSGATLTLQPADATNGGGVSTTTQTFGGVKTMTSPIFETSATIQRSTPASSGVVPYLTISTAADTGGTASTESPVLSVGGQNKTWATGALTTQRSSLFSQPTYAFVGSSTITNAATVGIAGAPLVGSNAAITNGHALLISASAVGGGTTNSYGLTVNAQTGANTNFCAAFLNIGSQGRAVGIGTATPTATLHITRNSASTLGTANYLLIDPTSDTGLTASTEVSILSISSATRQWATGALTTQRDVVIGQPTYSFVGASTITTAATAYIGGAPIKGTNASITNAYGLYISTGASTSGATNAFGLRCESPTGAGTSNVAASFSGGNFQVLITGIGVQGRSVGIGVSTPAATLDVTKDTPSTLGANPLLSLTSVLDTGLTASTEVPLFNITNTNARTWATGAITTQRELKVGQPTYSFAGASTITNAATIAVLGAPIVGTNASITNTHGILIQAASSTNSATNSYGLTCNAQTGATNNYSAQFLGGITTGVNFSQGYTTTATAAGTTTLTSTSNQQQYFTGSTTQTVVLPVASTMVLGQSFTIVNLSSGALTVNSSGGNLVKTINANSYAIITCILTSGTDAASWSVRSDTSVSSLSINVQTFTANGTFTPSSGMVYCIVEAVGAGGGGGGGASTAGGQGSVGGGGGSGAYARALYSAATIGASKSVTIGAGGTAGASSGGAGGAGNATVLGSTLISCPGGSGGGGGSASASSSTLGGEGGTAPTINSAIGSSSSNGQPGGAAFQVAGTGNSGIGAVSALGKGGRALVTGGAGNAGEKGGGGSGCIQTPSQGGDVGGVGGDGYMVITEFILS